MRPLRRRQLARPKALLQVRSPAVALACKGPLNARLATGVGLSFFLSSAKPCLLSLPWGPIRGLHASLRAAAKAGALASCLWQTPSHDGTRSGAQPCASGAAAVAALGCARAGSSARAAGLCLCRCETPSFAANNQRITADDVTALYGDNPPRRPVWDGPPAADRSARGYAPWATRGRGRGRAGRGGRDAAAGAGPRELRPRSRRPWEREGPGEEGEERASGEAAAGRGVRGRRSREARPGRPGSSAEATQRMLQAMAARMQRAVCLATAAARARARGRGLGRAMMRATRRRLPRCARVVGPA